MDDLLFTPAALLSVLLKIEELKDHDIRIYQTLDGDVQLQIDDSVYSLEPENETVIDVEESDLEAVEDANMEAYSDLKEEGEDVSVEISEEPIQSGIIKEALKSMLLGGMIRLSKKILS